MAVSASSAIRTFALFGVPPEPGGLGEDVVAALGARGFSATPFPNEAAIVLNLVDSEAPRPFRRKARGTFVAALWSLPEMPADPLTATYPMLVRALANISLCHVPGHGVLFTTMERGNSLVPEGPELAAQVVERLEPLATSTLVIDNEFRTDLEPELWEGDEHTREIAA